MAKKPKILLIDVESAPALTATHTLWPNGISYKSIVQDWFLICACWKWLGEKKIYSSQIKNETEDKKVADDLAKVWAEADIVIGHNHKKFDSRKLQSRLIFHHLPPLANTPLVDTLLEVRKTSAEISNRLDYLGIHLIGEKKRETGQELWLKAMKGNKEVQALTDMVRYCKQDVNLLEKVYLRLRPYMKTHPHLGVLRGHDRDRSCHKCESTRLQNRGTYVTAAGLTKQRMVCTECGSWQTFPFKK